jgi:hypothetical protein
MEAGMLLHMDDEESRRFTAMAWRVLGMLPFLKKKATVGQSNAWHAQRRLRLHHACMTHEVDFINKFCLTESHIMCSHGMVVFLLFYVHDLSHIYLTLMPDIGVSMLGLSGFIMHRLCRGLDGLYVFQQVVSMLLVSKFPT